jgi:UDP-2-acetamido-3-amino-2,3-dideoxy-glucuronate N-acetyltransferase
MGYWGKNLARNLHDLGALKLICDAAPERLSSATEQYPDVPVCADYSSALADPQITAVALATPAVSRYQMAREALEADKDVFVEKPLSLTIREGQDLVALAARRKRILMVGHILRYHPAVVEIQKLIREGHLGCVEYLCSNRLNIGKIRTEENILWSFAPHDISTMLALLGKEPSSVLCQGTGYVRRQGEATKGCVTRREACRAARSRLEAEVLSQDHRR